MPSTSASGNVTARMTHLPHGPVSFYRLTIGGNWSPAIVSRRAVSGREPLPLQRRLVQVAAVECDALPQPAVDLRRRLRHHLTQGGGGEAEERGGPLPFPR